LFDVPRWKVLFYFAVRKIALVSFYFSPIDSASLMARRHHSTKKNPKRWNMNQKEEGRKRQREGEEDREEEKERQGGFPPFLLVCVACVSLSPSLSLSFSLSLFLSFSFFLPLSFFPSPYLLEDIYPRENLYGESYTKISFQRKEAVFVWRIAPEWLTSSRR
jgi:hypothetical protein